MEVRSWSGLLHNRLSTAASAARQAAPRRSSTAPAVRCCWRSHQTRMGSITDWWPSPCPLPRTSGLFLAMGKRARERGVSAASAPSRTNPRPWPGASRPSPTVPRPSRSERAMNHLPVNTKPTFVGSWPSREGGLRIGRFAIHRHGYLGACMDGRALTLGGIECYPETLSKQVRVSGADAGVGLPSESVSASYPLFCDGGPMRPGSLWQACTTSQSR